MSASAETDILLRTLRKYKEDRQSALSYMALHASSEELVRVQKLPIEALVSYFMEKFKIGEPMPRLRIPNAFKHFALFARVLTQEQLNIVFERMYAYVQTIGDEKSIYGLYTFLDTIFNIHDSADIWKKILSIPTFVLTDGIIDKFKSQWITLLNYTSRVYTAFLQKVHAEMKAANVRAAARIPTEAARVVEARAALQKQGKNIRGAAALFPGLPRNVVSSISSYATGRPGNILEQSKQATSEFQTTVLNESAVRLDVRLESLDKLFSSYLPLGVEERVDGMGYGFRIGLCILFPMIPEFSSDLSIDDAILMAQTTLQAQIQEEMEQEANEEAAAAEAAAAEENEENVGMGGGSRRRRRHRKTRSCARKSKSKKTRRTRCRK